VGGELGPLNKVVPPISFLGLGVVVCPCEFSAVVYGGSALSHHQTNVLWTNWRRGELERFGNNRFGGRRWQAFICVHFARRVRARVCVCVRGGQKKFSFVTGALDPSRDAGESTTFGGYGHVVQHPSPRRSALCARLAPTCAPLRTCELTPGQRAKQPRYTLGGRAVHISSQLMAGQTSGRVDVRLRAFPASYGHLTTRNAREKVIEQQARRQVL